MSCTCSQVDIYVYTEFSKETIAMTLENVCTASWRDRGSICNGQRPVPGEKQASRGGPKKPRVGCLRQERVEHVYMSIIGSQDRKPLQSQESSEAREGFGSKGRRELDFQPIHYKEEGISEQREFSGLQRKVSQCT